jgi:putative Holliday junction resolvase
MKIIALDIGDKWTGVAISDPLGILARPYKTAESENLFAFLSDLFSQEKISSAVVGLPTTLRGTSSAQTNKIIATKEELEQQFPTITWVLWDERFTSKQAAHIKPSKNKDDKLQSHSIAAAIILSTYLEFQRIHIDNNQ